MGDPLPAPALCQMDGQPQLDDTSRIHDILLTQSI